ncbi:MAG: ABC transporter permease [Betaproteobacteria bacterium]|nr:ABC transporter permease [Betaproteobacteria bacterium]
MNPVAILALVRNDLRIHFSDRRGVLINIAAAIFIAGFMGFLFGGSGKTKEMGRIPVVITIEDDSDVARAIGAALAADKMLDAKTATAGEARELVRKGKAQAGLILPQGFGEAAAGAFFRGRDKPQIELFYDPSQSIVVSVVEGLLTQYVMQEVSKAMFGGPLGGKVVTDSLADLRKSADADTPAGKELTALLESVEKLNARARADAGAKPAAGGIQGGLSVPYTVHSEALTSGTGARYNGYAHSFAGMSVQFILFNGIEAGVLLLLLRERGLWARLRTAPIARADLLVARALATTVIGLFMLGAVYLVAMVAFGVRIEGSVAGFAGIAIAFCILNACFGLLLAALGRTPAATRGLAVMVTLILVMIGGAWVPAFIFPPWLQQLSLFAPTRWAVDGLDAVTWRGLGFDAAIGPIVVLLGSALVCGVVALWRFRWQS